MKTWYSRMNLWCLPIVAVLALLPVACAQSTNDATMPPTPDELPFADANETNTDIQTNSSDMGSGSQERSRPSINVVRPLDGETVPRTFEIEIEVSNFELMEEGRAVAGGGHWHAIVDQGCAEPGELIPAGSNHFHAGDGSATRTIQLSPGPHELCIQIGDGFHVAVNVSQTINIVVR